MPRSVVLLVGVLSIFLAACASQGPSKAERRAEQESARAVADRWLRLLDQGDYAEAFEWEAQDFRMFRTQQQFVRYMQARRAPFGRALSRKIIGSAAVQEFVGMPEGQYQSVIFKTNFDKKSPTAERVILLKQPAGWRVVDYRIY